MDRHAHKHWRHCQSFINRLARGNRPASFEAAYGLVTPKVCGLYDMEAKALWDILQREYVADMVEVGRNLGGGLVFLVCACPELRRVESIDIKPIPEIDHWLKLWVRSFGIECEFVDADSATVTPVNRLRDFVWIDGGHTAAAVRADIEAWHDKTRLIGFHDYADLGWNKHVRAFPRMTAEITRAAECYDWVQVGERGRSEVVFKTRRY